MGFPSWETMKAWHHLWHSLGHGATENQIQCSGPYGLMSLTLLCSKWKISSAQLLNGADDSGINDNTCVLLYFIIEPILRNRYVRSCHWHTHELPRSITHILFYSSVCLTSSTVSRTRWTSVTGYLCWLGRIFLKAGWTVTHLKKKNRLKTKNRNIHCQRWINLFVHGDGAWAAWVPRGGCATVYLDPTATICNTLQHTATIADKAFCVRVHVHCMRAPCPRVSIVRACSASSCTCPAHTCAQALFACGCHASFVCIDLSPRLLSYGLLGECTQAPLHMWVHAYLYCAKYNKRWALTRWYSPCPAVRSCAMLWVACSPEM